MAGTRDRGDPPRHDQGLTPAPDDRIAAAQDSLAAAFREESSRLTASVTRILGGDFAAAEEVVQDALLAAWRQWPADGVPDQPAAWLRTVARRRAIDVLRRYLRYRDRLAATAFPVGPAASPAGDEADDRLMLIFTCCHPALATEAQVALTLRTVCGLTTAEIARAFLVISAGGLGGLAGAAGTGWLTRRFGPLGVIMFCCAVSGAAMLLLGAAFLAPVALAANALYTWAIVAASVTNRSLRQALVPRPVLGRVTASWRLSSQAVTLAGGLLAGAAAALAGSPRPVFAAAGVLTVVTVTTAWLAALRHEQLPPGLLVRAGPGPPP